MTTNNAAGSIQEFFALLNPDTRMLLAGGSDMVTIRKGGFLWLPGEDPKHVFFQVSGFCQIRTVSAEGLGSSVGIGVPGQLLGEAEVIAGTPRFNEVVVREDAGYLRVSGRRFLEALDSDHVFCRAMTLVSNAKLLGVFRYCGYLQSGTVETRMAYVLCLLSDLCGVDGSGVAVIPFVISQETLAGYAGTTRQTCNRLLTMWGTEDLLDLIEGRIRLRDLAGMRRLAGLDGPAIALSLQELIRIVSTLRQR